MLHTINIVDVKKATRPVDILKHVSVYCRYIKYIQYNTMNIYEIFEHTCVLHQRIAVCDCEKPDSKEKHFKQKLSGGINEACGRCNH